MQKYKVKSFTWENGILKKEVRIFHDQTSAINFAINHGADLTKVLDPSGRIIYKLNNTIKTKPPAKSIKVILPFSFETYA